MSDDDAERRALATAYTHLQRAVGLIAVTLPFVLFVGDRAISCGELEGSISSYYHTSMGNYFVGSLSALAVFFLSYNYRPLPKYKWDNVFSNFASVAALGVAFFPTTRNAETASHDEKAIAAVHVGFAITLFVLLGIFALVFFTRWGGTTTPEKKRRNRVYRVCGVIIFLAIALAGVSNYVEPPDSWHALFWLEAIAVVAFGVSWLVKGGFLGILADREPSAPA